MHLLILFRADGIRDHFRLTPVMHIGTGEWHGLEVLLIMLGYQKCKKVQYLSKISSPVLVIGTMGWALDKVETGIVRFGAIA